ncbi:MAG TPA: hypothetical protein VMZ73_01750 [Acidimicrobiales bacterium]|nr:hypothetical protein [Acidimicrobiales bacterium]
MRRLVVSLGLVAVLGLTGCGGGGDDDDAAPAQTTAAPPTTALVGNDQAGTPFCGLARTYTEKFSTLLAVANDPVKLKAATTDAEAAIRQAQTTAPAEIKSDVGVVATTAKDVLAALQKNNFDLSKTAEVSKLQEPRFQTSLANMNRYARAHCGVA